MITRSEANASRDTSASRSARCPVGMTRPSRNPVHKCRFSVLFPYLTQPIPSAAVAPLRKYFIKSLINGCITAIRRAFAAFRVRQENRQGEWHAKQSERQGRNGQFPICIQLSARCGMV